MVFEFESFIAIVAFEFAQQRALVVADHVPLQPVHVCEAFVADLARLLTKYCSYNTVHEMLHCGMNREYLIYLFNASQQGRCKKLRWYREAVKVCITMSRALTYLTLST